MLPPPIRETADIIRRLPGIGPRQALRCAFYILRHPETRQDLKLALEKIETVKNCLLCWRSIQLAPNSENSMCSICRDLKRNKSLLCVVEEDADLEQLEKAGIFHGKYFVFGGRLSLNQNPQSLRINEFKQRIANDKDIKEIIMAMSPTPEGNAAFLWLKQEILSAISDAQSIKITRLGIGMPSGGEIEYADEETLRGAIANRA